MLQLLMFAMYQGTAEEDMWKKDLKRPRMNHVLPQHWNQQEIPAPSCCTRGTRASVEGLGRSPK